MTILVTGASGFTGSHVCQQLANKGKPVRGFIRSTSDRSRLKDPTIPLFEGDISDVEAVTAACAGVDTVIHTAGYVELGIVNATAMHEANVLGTKSVLQAAKSSSVRRIVYCSTIGVFGDHGMSVIDETATRTQHGFDSVYDKTKLDAQRLVDEAAAQGQDVVTVLPSGIFGPGDPHFGPAVRAFLSGKLPVWLGLDRPTGIVDVLDIADLLIVAGEKGNAGDWFIGSAGELTPRKMFSILGEANGIAVPKELPRWIAQGLGSVMTPIGKTFNLNVPISRERLTYIYDRLIRVDSAKACTKLGWKPRSPDEIIRGLLT